jgi:2-octaprenyl-6-methoxyphenol hydroxylase
MASTRERFDIVIVGGGLVGATLARALAPLGLRLAVIEAVPLGAAQQPSYDDRATALAWGSRQILAGIGLWDALAPDANPIRHIHISDRGRFGHAELHAAEHGVDALGYVALNRGLGAALHAALEAQADCRFLCPARLEAVASDADGVTCQVRIGDAVQTIEARLLVAADGARSGVRELLGIGARTWDYGQTAIITNVTPSLPHQDWAWERFTDSGPIALLPLTDQRCAVVWTVATERAPEVLALDDAAFLARFTERFGDRLGGFTRVGRRVHHPLAMVRAEDQVATRAVIVGNAAHSLHPIAGQGFNLSLRDIAALAEVIADAVAAGGDPGDAALLARYQAWRAGDQRETMLFTDGLTRVFGNPLGSVALARNLGLLAFDLLPPVKQLLARHTMGLAGRLPRLARGLPLA